MKCLQNVEFDDLVFLECIYPRLTMDNTAVSAVGLMGAGKLRAGVRVRALSSPISADIKPACHETNSKTLQCEANIFGNEPSARLNQIRTLSLES